ncbi:DUF4350 domain-containing protein [Pseudomonas sp. HR96]|uniref:DUF4350 domain-containing protein n=1 Tax=Pseudomonas sp. HR96 TaxID=1027966 RepID=UPI002A75BD7A|nr:DUF4350 domain-containing protein [Pseudomonas sp. HR96]WPO99128.1 DUF4350 domain-containing protein [Pseudomonas sp. HR96]
MSRRRTWLWLAVAAVLALVVGSGALGRLESYRQWVDLGPSAEARGDDYLAAQLFLRQQGVTVQRAPGLEVLDQLDPRGASLLLLGERQRMSPNQADRLLRWVRAGGRLLFVAQALWDQDKAMSGDLLLDRLQLHQLQTRDLPRLSPGDRIQYPELTRLYLENEKAPAYFSFDPAWHLEDPMNKVSAWANNATATHLMQLRWGDGLITVVTDADLWRNAAIGQYDNAWLLWYLTQDSQVALVGDAQHDSLTTLLWRYFPQALLALLALLLLGGWHFALRQGPVQTPPPPARRRLREHLDASASFLLRRAGHASLLRALQRDILRRARRRHPGFERLPVAEQWQVLARLSRQPTAAIADALRPRPRQRLQAAEFCRQVAHLQIIRNAL